MHKAILSERERKLLTKYLNDETITDVTFRMLKLRIKRNFNCIKQDYKLLEQVMVKLQQKRT